ncbi:MAG: ferrous iron transport protein A [Candidatus Thorarchaeota archaeon]
MARLNVEEQSFQEIKTADSKTKSLLMLKTGQSGIIKDILGGHRACKRLNELGLVPGVEVVVVNKISSGPLMIKVKGSKLALGRGLADKVIIISD